VEIRTGVLGFGMEIIMLIAFFYIN